MFYCNCQKKDDFKIFPKAVGTLEKLKMFALECFCLKLMGTPIVFVDTSGIFSATSCAIKLVWFELTFPGLSKAQNVSKHGARLSAPQWKRCETIWSWHRNAWLSLKARIYFELARFTMRERRKIAIVRQRETSRCAFGCASDRSDMVIAATTKLKKVAHSRWIVWKKLNAFVWEWRWHCTRTPCHRWLPREKEEKALKIKI